MTEAQNKFFADLRQEMKTQDNACTSHPLFVVYEKRRTYGLNEDVSDNCAWLDTYGDYNEATGQKLKALERYYRRFHREPDGWRRTFWHEVDRFVTCAFTRRAAQAYIDKRSYNYKFPLHIFVESMYRMQEMINLQAAIRDGVFEAKVQLCG